MKRTKGLKLFQGVQRRSSRIAKKVIQSYAETKYSHESGIKQKKNA